MKRVINIVLRVYRKSGIADSQITVIQKFRSLNALNIVLDVSALFAFLSVHYCIELQANWFYRLP